MDIAESATRKNGRQGRQLTLLPASGEDAGDSEDTPFNVFLHLGEISYEWFYFNQFRIKSKLKVDFATLDFF